MPMWRDTLAEAAAMGSEHLSCYEVIYEEDTPLFAQLQAGEFDVDEDLACEMYDELLTVAAAKGYQQYEVANFARHLSTESAEVPDRACRHNINYWRGASFYGPGPSASGYVTVFGQKLVEHVLLSSTTGIRAIDPVSASAVAPRRRNCGLRNADECRLAISVFGTTGFDLRRNIANRSIARMRLGLRSIRTGFA
jgi:hypothetical protein